MLLIIILDISRDDAEQLAAKLKRVVVADLIENLEVSIVPFAIEKHEICSIYKLKIKLYAPELYPSHTDITLEDCHNTLLNEYLKELEAAIKSHLLLLSRICGIKSDALPKGSDGMNGDDSGSKTRSENDEDDDDDDDDDDEGADDFGSNAQKRKQRVTDEVDYEDDSEEEVEEGKLVAEGEHEVELDEEVEEGKCVAEGEPEVELDEDEEETKDADGEESVEQDVPETPSGPLSQQQKRPEAKQRKFSEKDLTVHVACDGLFFEVHFKLTNEPHILLSKVCLDCKMFLSVNSQYFFLASDERFIDISHSLYMLCLGHCFSNISKL